MQHQDVIGEVARGQLDPERAALELVEGFFGGFGRHMAAASIAGTLGGAGMETLHLHNQNPVVQAAQADSMRHIRAKLGWTTHAPLKQPGVNYKIAPPEPAATAAPPPAPVKKKGAPAPAPKKRRKV